MLGRLAGDRFYFSGIPGYLKLRGSIYYYYVSLNSKEHRYSTLETHIEKAKSKAESRYRLLSNRPVIPDKRYVFADAKTWEQIIDECRLHSNNWLGYMLRRAKDRSRRRSIRFNLTKEQLLKIALSSKGCCQVSGIQFSFQKAAKHKFSPYSPALDRIDSKKGYTFRNCRLVCNCVNAAMGEWGEEVLYTIVQTMNKSTPPTTL